MNGYEWLCVHRRKKPEQLSKWMSVPIVIMINPLAPSFETSKELFVRIWCWFRQWRPSLKAHFRHICFCDLKVAIKFVNDNLVLSARHVRWPWQWAEDWDQNGTGICTKIEQLIHHWCYHGRPVTELHCDADEEHERIHTTASATSWSSQKKWLSRKVVLSNK